MKNVAIIEIASPAFMQVDDKVRLSTIPTNQQLEFGCELCRTLSTHLEKAGLRCFPPNREFKLGGGAFGARMGKKHFCISVGLERKRASKTEVTVWAQPHFSFLSVVYPRFNEIWIRWHKQVWDEFGQHLKNAVESQFQGRPVKWMTEEEWIASLPENPFD